MELNFIWDTNIVIYYLQKQFPPAAEQFIDTLTHNLTLLTRNIHDFNGVNDLTCIDPWTN